jgi:putative endonuclease
VIPPPLSASVGENGMYYVYFLRSLTTGRTYLGWTTDIRRRLAQHNDGESRSTKGRGPYELFHLEAYRHREEAQAREFSLKKHPNVLRQLRNRLFRTMVPASFGPKEVVG